MDTHAPGSVTRDGASQGVIQPFDDEEFGESEAPPCDLPGSAHAKQKGAMATAVLFAAPMGIQPPSQEPPIHDVSLAAAAAAAAGSAQLLVQTADADWRAALYRVSTPHAFFATYALPLTFGHLGGAGGQPPGEHPNVHGCSCPRQRFPFFAADAAAHNDPLSPRPPPGRIRRTRRPQIVRLLLLRVRVTTSVQVPLQASDLVCNAMTRFPAPSAASAAGQLPDGSQPTSRRGTREVSLGGARAPC